MATRLKTASSAHKMKRRHLKMLSLFICIFTQLPVCVWWCDGVCVRHADFSLRLARQGKAIQSPKTFRAFGFFKLKVECTIKGIPVHSRRPKTRRGQEVNTSLLCRTQRSTPQSLRIRHVVRKSVQNANDHFDQQLKQHQIAQFWCIITVKFVRKIRLAGKINFKPNFHTVQQSSFGIYQVRKGREEEGVGPFSHKLLFQWEATETGIATANVVQQHPESQLRSQSHCTSSNNNTNNNKGELCSSFCFFLPPPFAPVFCLLFFSSLHFAIFRVSSQLLPENFVALVAIFVRRTRHKNDNKKI